MHLCAISKSHIIHCKLWGTKVAFALKSQDCRSIVSSFSKAQGEQSLNTCRRAIINQSYCSQLHASQCAVNFSGSVMKMIQNQVYYMIGCHTVCWNLSCKEVLEGVCNTSWLLPNDYLPSQVFVDLRPQHLQRTFTGTSRLMENSPLYSRSQCKLEICCLLPTLKHMYKPVLSLPQVWDPCSHPRFLSITFYFHQAFPSWKVFLSFFFFYCCCIFYCGLLLLKTAAAKSWYMYIKYANNLANWNKNSTST